MIERDAPYKLREIIHDTWPQIFTFNRLVQECKDGSINTSTTKERMVRCP